MNRLQKKCAIATAGFHLLLLVILIVGPGFFAPKPKADDLQILDVIPANLIDAAFNSGVRNAQPPPPVVQPRTATARAATRRHAARAAQSGNAGTHQASREGADAGAEARGKTENSNQHATRDPHRAEKSRPRIRRMIRADNARFGSRRSKTPFGV